jgi:hypothetical protein
MKLERSREEKYGRLDVPIWRNLQNIKVRERNFQIKLEKEINGKIL